MRISMAARGKVVTSAVSSGHHEITKGMRKTRSIGQDIERWWKVNEVQIPGTKDALYRAFLDSLVSAQGCNITFSGFSFSTTADTSGNITSPIIANGIVQASCSNGDNITCSLHNVDLANAQAFENSCQ